MIDISKLKKTLPATPGVYLMRAKTGEVLYIGKAANLKRRVMSYFERPQDARISAMVAQIDRVDIRKTPTALEALILESRLIKQYQTRYNIKDKDDRSFLFIVVTREAFPRVLLVRGKDLHLYEQPLAQFGPFTSASALRAAMNILRKIFPWSVHTSRIYESSANIRTSNTVMPYPCFDYQIGLCPGTCIGAITKKEYRVITRQLIRFLRGSTSLTTGGERKGITRDLRAAMRRAAKELRFEDAAKLRKRLHALKHIEDVALIGRDDVAPLNIPHRVEGACPLRIEGYDISNISGTAAVGSMIVFINGRPDKSQYRKFKIKTVKGADDVAMLREVITRRFHNNWLGPNMILIDGGLPQVNAVREALRRLPHKVRLGKPRGFAIPVVGIAKGPERKRNDFFFSSLEGKKILSGAEGLFLRQMLIRVRDEAHRFAIAYHRSLRGRRFLSKE